MKFVHHPKQRNRNAEKSKSTVHWFILAHTYYVYKISKVFHILNRQAIALQLDVVGLIPQANPLCLAS